MRKISVVQAALEIFEEENRPLHYKELTKMILRKRKIQSRTPEQSVRSRIATDPRFKRIGGGVYALTKWTTYPETRYAKDIAYDFLKARGEPVSLKELGEAIAKERHFDSGPIGIARNVLKADRRLAYDRAYDLVSLKKWRL